MKDLVKELSKESTAKLEVQLTHGLPTPMVATTLTPLGKSIEA
jgi:hypothetical protein